MAQEQTISWHVSTHEHKERSADWYWTLGVVALVGAAISIFFSNVLLAIILLVGAAAVGYLVARGPREHEVRLDARGVSVDGTLYRFASIHSFWVEEEHGEPTLFLTTGGILTPHFSFPLESLAHAGQVRAYLHGRVPEVEQSRRLGEHVAELFGL